MKILILLILLLPYLLIAGWIKQGNGYISEDTLIGDKRFIPEENTIIVENKDYVLKYDLTTGEIIKKVDIDEPDTNYRQAVANDDLSEIYLFYEYINIKPFNYANVKYIVKSNKDKKIIFDYNIPSIELGSSFRKFVVNSNLFFIDNNFIISGKIQNEAWTYYRHTQFSNIIKNIVPIDTSKSITFSVFLKSYSEYYPKVKKAIFRKTYEEADTYGQISYTDDNEIAYFDFDSLIYKRLTMNYNYNQQYKSVAIAKDSNFVFYQTDNSILEKDHIKHHLNLNIDATNRFVNYDNSLLYCYKQYNNLIISINDLYETELFRDTILNVNDNDILFEDGSTFYFNSNGKIFKYTPAFLNKTMLRAEITDVDSVYFVGEVVNSKSLTSGQPKEFQWFIDDSLVTEYSFLNYAFKKEGKHYLKFKVSNELMYDSIVKEITILPLTNLKRKEIDFYVDKYRKNNKGYEFKVVDTSNFNEFHWNFGDGKMAVGNNLVHIYDEDGTYSVTLTGIREDDTYSQEIKYDVIEINQEPIDYSTKLFETFELRDSKYIYFKSIRTLFNVNVKIVDKNNITLFENFFKILSKGEIYNFRPPVNGEFKIILKNSNGEVYEY